MIEPLEFLYFALSAGAISQLSTVLTGAGFAVDQVKDFFSSLGGRFAGFFETIGKVLNPANW